MISAQSMIRIYEESDNRWCKEYGEKLEDTEEANSAKSQ